MSDPDILWHLSADGTVWFGIEPIHEFVAQQAPPNVDRPPPTGRPNYDYLRSDKPADDSPPQAD